MESQAASQLQNDPWRQRRQGLYLCFSASVDIFAKREKTPAHDFVLIQPTDMKRFDLEIFFYAELRPFTTQPRLLYAAERRNLG